MSQQTISGSPVSNTRSYERWHNLTMSTLYRFNEVNIYGQEHIPPEEPLLICASHRGFGDIPAINELMMPFGHYRAVAKAGLFRVPLLGWALEHSWNSIKIDPKRLPTDKMLLDMLSTFHHEEDPYLAIYPEAKRVKEDIEKIKSVSPFIGKIACFGQVRCLPVGIWGSHKHRSLLGFSDLTVVAGKTRGPFTIDASYRLTTNQDGTIDYAKSTVDRLSKSDKDTIRVATTEIHDAMQECLDEAIELSKS